ncbi:pentatricopeptide repeat-containing protein At5g16860 [Aristolochia californica]|uniref:pentatricopeptide repeat-containing protein At5g16860 n=1 Tax=Aristolochia californica TaxID=171875 RepID=UPI0035D7297B
MLLHLPQIKFRPTVRFFCTSSVFITTLLQECKTVVEARLVHQQILTTGLHLFPSQTPLSTAIVGAYLACNAPVDALLTIEHLSPSAIFCWNVLIRHHVRNERYQEALSVFYRMQKLDAKPDHFTFPFVLKACGELPSFRRGTAVHAVVCRDGFEWNVFVCNALISMYYRCGSLEDAARMFEEITQRKIDDVVSWNSMVAAYMQSDEPHHALQIFRAMRTKAEAVSLVNVLPASGSLGSSLQVKELHCYAERNGLLRDVFVGNAVVDAYAKCGMMEEAVKVFDRMEVKDLVSWNAMVTGYAQAGNFDGALQLFTRMREDSIQLNVVTWSAVIAGYAQRGLGYEAINVFQQMQLSRSQPNAVTIISLLSACAAVGALSKGKETHAYALKRVLKWTHDDGDDLMIENGLIDMYSKCRRADMALQLFNSIPLSEKNVVTWTVLIGGYAQQGDANDALKLFSKMLKEANTLPNAFTISCALMACSRLSALRFGKEIHAYVIRNRYERAMLFVTNCLIDMYAKCGDIDIARRVFDKMLKRNAVSWTSLMTGYGMHGRGEDALYVFDEMRDAGLVPDGVTFVVVLYACSHSGMVEQGLEYFNNMNREYGVAAGVEHFACTVDLLGRAGRLSEAKEVIETMPMEPTSVVWLALLSACRVHANVELGEYAAKRLLELEPENDGFYTLLSNIYANARQWKDVLRIRSLMKRAGIRKRPGCSWIQRKEGNVSFFVGDRSNPRSREIYEVLTDLMERIKVIGYIPETRFALHDVDDEEKKYLLSEHSEKLALAYGILTTAAGMPIRITKNLRVCGDCHIAFTFVSKIVDHEIIVRDPSRFHHFKKGSCSCGGYW